MRYVVGRPFEAGGRQLQSGEVVTGEGWRNLRQLLSQRYLIVIDRDAEPSAPAPRPRGRTVQHAE